MVDKEELKMNICFLYGKIVSKIEFDFLYNSKIHTSVVTMEVLPNGEKQIVLVKAYDENADKIYKEFDIGSYITLMGKVEKNNIKILEVK